METNKKSSFSGRLGYVMAVAGSAVGVGNIWRFPASGFIRSHRRESSVDLPQPDGPTIDVKLPGFISKERSLITGVSPFLS